MLQKYAQACKGIHEHDEEKKKTHMELLEITNMIAEMKSTLDGINIR